MRRILIALALLLGLATQAHSQPIARPYPFDIVPLDTVSSEVLDALSWPARMLDDEDRLKLGTDSHLQNLRNERVRLFGTSLLYTSQFLPQDDAKKLAVRLRKLGFNAVKLVNNDFFGWDDASFFKTYNDTWTEVLPSSYTVNPLQLARFDTLLYELKRNGIYTVLVLNSGHRYSHNEGVANWDSAYWNGAYHNYWDPGAQRLQKEWARTLMNHVNPLTGIAIKNDPMVAYVGFNQENSLYWLWQNHMLNYVDEANKLNQGLSTISWLDSRRLDTLYNQYLAKKYGTQANLVAAWGGDPNPPKRNLLDNGSFEKFTSSAWTFTASNGSDAGYIPGDGGIDSTVFAKIRINNLSSNPVYNDIIFYNLTPRLGFDTLYEVTFWAKMGYDHAKRPGVTQRTIGLLMIGYGGNQVGLNTTQVIDTSWKQYSFKFRAAANGLHYAYFYFGTELGDVWLDAIDVHRAPETALAPFEDLAARNIVRARYDQLSGITRARTRDMVMFYDSLESGWYKSLEDHLHGVGYHGLVNYTQTQWYSMLPDIKKASAGDIAEHHTGWDYVSGRPGLPSTDSTWMVRNTPMVKSTSAGTLYNMAANAVAGKGFIVGDYQVPWMNQYHSEHLVMVPAFAAYQDWDGIFFSPFATFREDLYATKLPNQYANEGSFSSIAKNPAILSLLPSASYVFRNGLISPAQAEDTITHIPNDVWLYPVHPGYRGYYGVDGWLDPNAATAFRMRQSFDAKTHRVAAEYPYLSDTSVKRFDRDQIVWDQTNGIFTVNAPRFIAGTGFFRTTPHGLDSIFLERQDMGNDPLTYYLIRYDSGYFHPKYLLTLSSRAQNSGLIWATDSLSFDKSFGQAPTVLSSSTVRFNLRSITNEGILDVAAVPLDPHGLPIGEDYPSGVEADNWARVVMDQGQYNTPYFFLDGGYSFPASVKNTSSIDITIVPNPVTDKMLISSPSSVVSVTIYDMLGQIRAIFEHADHIDVRSLPSGAYTVIIETAKGKKVLPLRKL